METKEKFILLCHDSGKIHIFDQYTYAEMYANMVGYYNYSIETKQDRINRKVENREKLINELLNDN